MWHQKSSDDRCPCRLSRRPFPAWNSQLLGTRDPSFAETLFKHDGMTSWLLRECRDKRGFAWVTTTTCARSVALAIKRARAGSRSGCKLVSGSFRTINAGGLGVKSAAIQSRYRSVPSESSAVLSGRRSPCWAMLSANRPSTFTTERRLPGKASSTAVSRMSSAPISRMVWIAAARSDPSLSSIGVEVPIWGERAGASASVQKLS
jgi:hypothetical protein